MKRLGEFGKGSVKMGTEKEGKGMEGGRERKWKTEGEESVLIHHHTSCPAGTRHSTSSLPQGIYGRTERLV